jgi:hypothetical protein
MANAGQLDPLLAREVKAAGSARPFIVRVSSDEEAIEGKARHTLRCNNIENGVALQPLRWEWDRAKPDWEIHSHAASAPRPAVTLLSQKLIDIASRPTAIHYMESFEAW